MLQELREGLLEKRADALERGDDEEVARIDEVLNEFNESF